MSDRKLNLCGVTPGSGRTIFFISTLFVFWVFCTNNKLEGGQSYPFLGFGKLYHLFCCFVNPSIPFILKIMQLYLKVPSISKRLSLLIDRRRFWFHFYVSYVHTIFESICKNYDSKNICLCFSWRWIVCIIVRAYACFQDLIQFIGR